MIYTALEIEKGQGGDKVSFLKTACTFEDQLTEKSERAKILGNQIEDKEKELKKNQDSLESIFRNPLIPIDTRRQRNQSLSTKIEGMRRELEDLKREKKKVEDQKVASENLIAKFIKRYWDHLPHSYREPTFQMAFDLTLPDGRVVYKQYNGNTGHFDL